MTWVAIWGNAMSIAENRPEGYARDITLRYKIVSAFAGDALKVTLDNYCGTEAVTISKVTVCIRDQFYPVLFDGKETVTMDAKGQAVSDELCLDCQAGESFTVQIYLGEFTQMKSAVYVQGPLSNQNQYAIGDQSACRDWDINICKKTNMVYFLSNISLRTAESNHALICYGDSITAQDWPDYLALRYKELGITNRSVIRRATSGSRILREYDCITYDSYGLKATNRFPHEAPTDGADAILIQQGINDIIHPVGVEVNPFRPMSDLPTAEELIEGLCYYIKEARALGYKVYVGTLLPIEGWRTYAGFREELRNAYNDWIRKTDLIDGCIDFDLALSQENHREAFIKEYDSGDHLHPSAAGYKCMADQVPLEF